MELWQGTIHDTVEAAQVEADDARIAMEQAGLVVTDVQVIEQEDGFYQPQFVVMSAEEYAHEQAKSSKRSWVPWAVTIGAVAVVGTLITVGVVYGE